MSVDRARRAWVRAVSAHLRAAGSHELAAELFATLHDSNLAVHESELAAFERQAYETELARHPEWADDVRGLYPLELDGGAAAKLPARVIERGDGRVPRVNGNRDDGLKAVAPGDPDRA